MILQDYNHDRIMPNRSYDAIRVIRIVKVTLTKGKEGNEINRLKEVGRPRDALKEAI